MKGKKDDLHTITNWQSWNIWENSLHMLQEKNISVTHYPANSFFIDIQEIILYW